MFELNSIFKKQFFFFFGILLISFVLLGVGLNFALSGYLESQKKDELAKIGTEIAGMYGKNFAAAKDFADKEELHIKDVSVSTRKDLAVLEKTLSLSFILVDANFYIIDSSKDVLLNPKLPLQLPAMPKTLNGEIEYQVSNLLGIYREDVVIVACPVIHDGEVIGVILLNSSLPEIEKSSKDISRVTLVAIIISGGVGFLLIYISSRKLSDPLQQMNEVAKDIVNGDFEKRIMFYTNDEVGQLAKSLNVMAESLYSQENQRRNFIANISHDLRSPLTSMRGFLTAIIDGTIPEDRRERYLRIILDETDRLSKLANDILDINKTEIIELHYTNFDIVEMIRKVVLQFEKRITDKNILLKFIHHQDSYIVSADFEKVQRILHNLVDNAVKFTNESGYIKIEIYSESEKIYISVKDSGIGISKSDQKNVFDRFYKVDESRGVDKKGSGLGLSIIREFIKAHNENITLISDVGKGTEIIFTLQMGIIGEGSILR